jgi:uncharacterized membrane protein YqaE (UPF0057 family)
LQFFCRPLGFLAGRHGQHFFINIILTVLGVLPGVLHALWLVVTKRSGA